MTEIETRAEPDRVGIDDADDEARTSGPWLMAGLVLALVLAALFAFLWQRSKDIEPAELTTALTDEAAVVENRAAEVIDLLTTYDSTNFEERADQLRELSTGTFADQYETLIDQGIRQFLEEATASSRGRLLDTPEISFTSATDAIVLARVSQTTQTDDNPQGQRFLYIFRFDFIKTGQEWKADQFEILAESPS